MCPLKKILQRQYIVLILHLGIFTLCSSISFAGGGDPSGGEGQASQEAQLIETTQTSLISLPTLFLRLKFFLQSENSEDQQLMANLSFLRDCYREDHGHCRGEVFETIRLVSQNFKSEPLLADGDCPSEEKTHTITDMSIGSKLKLCISKRLTRYPYNELKRQVLSLLAHEVIHALGFGESEAHNLQQWLLENNGFSFPSRVLALDLENYSKDISLDIRMLARLMGYRVAPEPQRVCEYFGTLQRHIDRLHTLFDNTAGTEWILVPRDPIINTSDQIYERSVILFFDHCKQRNPLTPKNLLASLKEIVLISDLFNQLRYNFQIYNYGLAIAESFTMTPNQESLLTLLEGFHDRQYPSSVAKGVTCTAKGDHAKTIHLARSTQLGETYALPIFDLIPNDLFNDGTLNIVLYTSQLNKNGGVGIMLNLEDSSSKAQKLKRPFPFKVKVLSTNESVNIKTEVPESSPFLFKVLGKEKTFETQLQILNQKNEAQTAGPVVSVQCRVNE